MKYKMKTDWWVRIILWFCIIMFVPMFFFVPEDEMFILVISTFFMAIIILPLFMSYYELDLHHLVIHIYFFKMKIKYENIKSLRMCENWYSSAAMSRERIEIKEHNKSKLRGTTFISPEDRMGFYSDLKQRCRNLDMIEDTNIFDDMEKIKYE